MTVEGVAAYLARSSDADSVVDRLLATAQQHLGMDLAYLAEFREGKQVFRGLQGDAASFGAVLGGSLPLKETFCSQMVAGALPNVVPDALADERVSDLAFTRGGAIRGYVGVPVRFPDGQLYGTLCCLNHEPDDTVGARDVKFMQVLADLMAQEIDAERRVADDQDAQRASIEAVLQVDGMHVALQPIAELGSGAVVGVEALARFDTTPYRPPDLWFAEASAVGLGVELEVAAITLALASLPTLPGTSFLGVNVSPNAARSDALAEALARAPLDRLVLEVTEHAHVDDYAATRVVLKGFRSRGARVAIDDAGAGYASFAHILQLEPDFIKLDISLVRGIDADPARRALASAFVAFARETGASIIAEGIETEAELQTVRRLGVAYGQGYHLGRPIPFHPMLPEEPEPDMSRAGIVPMPVVPIPALAGAMTPAVPGGRG